MFLSSVFWDYQGIFEGLLFRAVWMITHTCIHAAGQPIVQKRAAVSMSETVVTKVFNRDRIFYS